ncbi:polysaccharide deacetylase [Mycolicibacterium fortuitum subsp. fortuitum DSM 46621 = ATCC 6841 = JCM 6387]|uniref:Polysaccharide deacetylase n=1 Tax=Mycolicibacterium fortuitum subsp. fortuitum DSM 46621 = ATCC 6841 = JCM 6387 TaxID=1214102 RepID=K0V5K5_MYCFO|nr:polysaccharide deacetylase [Mycolicibacterium fortuitum subsp. fortuitum DSM 46621 = ATCC 6841 = JCM 6387]
MLGADHPFLSGRASRAAELDHLMRYVRDHTDV